MIMNIVNVIAIILIVWIVFTFIVVVVVSIIDDHFRHYDAGTNKTFYCTEQTLAKRRMQKDPWIWYTTYVDEYGHKKWFKEAARKRFIND